MKGNGKVYICIFDGPGLPRGQRSTIDNKRRTKTTAFDKGTTAYQMGTAKPRVCAEPYKKQDVSVRKQSKKQGLSVRKKHKKPGHSWTRTARRQSDTEIQKDFQQRFEILGGAGIVSLENAIRKCGTKTNFYGKNDDVRLQACGAAAFLHCLFRLHATARRAMSVGRDGRKNVFEQMCALSTNICVRKISKYARNI